MRETLEGLGLTEGESKVYSALLSLGLTTSGALVRDTGLQKSSVYASLDKLIARGLVSYIIRNNRKEFEAAKPAAVIKLIEEKEQQMEEQKKSLVEFARKMTVTEKERVGKEARLFEGWRGMESAFGDITETLGKGEEVLTFGVSTSDKVFDRFRRFIAKFHQIRARKGIRTSILVNDTFRDTIGKDRKKERHTNVRFLPKEYVTPAVVNIYSDKVLIAIWVEQPQAVVIKSKEAADAFRNYFHILWSIGKP